MSPQDLFDRVLVSLHDATLDDVHWPDAAALIDEACGLKGNCLVFGERSPEDNVQIYMARFFHRGQRRRDWETEYFRVYHPRDERPPRLSRLPDGLIKHVRELYTLQEAKTSPVYNEALVRSESQNSLNVRLDGPQGTSIVLATADPVGSAGWQPDQIALIRRLLPHLRHFVSVRHALAEAGSVAASLAELLDTT